MVALLCIGWVIVKFGLTGLKIRNMEWQTAFAYKGRHHLK